MNSYSKIRFQYYFLPLFNLAIFILYILINIQASGKSVAQSIYIIAVLSSLFLGAISARRINGNIDVKLLSLLFFFFAYEFVIASLTAEPDGISFPKLLDSNFGAAYKLLFGLSLGINLKLIVEFLRIHPSPSNALILKNFILFCLLSIVSILLIKLDTYGLKVTNIVRIDKNHEGYQRLGVMTIILNIICGAFLVIKSERNFSISSYIIYSFLCLTSAILCILSISNMGFVANIILLFSTTSVLWFTRGKQTFDNVFLGFFVKYGGLSVLAILLCFLVLFAIYPEKVSSIRLFDFSSNSSFLSRYLLFGNSFFSQFGASPVFGDLSSHLRSGESGSYVHSLLSLFTHLGLVGVTLFIALIAYCFYASVIASGKGCRYAFLMLVNLSIFIFIALLTSFYVWVPLWIIITMMIFLKGQKGYLNVE
ncbi:hypothetical protein [Enterovibrio norvegicus]|uniref:O-antigen ligase like membrane protein n=1 Tax=Enterovibrio norvegicus DSM 15893 TaxID=1121869 RepID=A0A1I5N988_9GAMM|nr:hypothetical protein [Enterovibrio norvegicus]SFP18284.1 hypothetical protein SAMN03084138_01525 [Enterovibrio norvegicus DSM 15893]